MSSRIGNIKIAARRDIVWKKKLSEGHQDAALRPSKIFLQRVSLGISQKEMSVILNISMSTYGAIERGRRKVKLDRATKISKSLLGEVKDFFDKSPKLEKKYVAKKRVLM